MAALAACGDPEFQLPPTPQRTMGANSGSMSVYFTPTYKPQTEEERLGERQIYGTEGVFLSAYRQNNLLVVSIGPNFVKLDEAAREKFCKAVATHWGLKPTDLVYFEDNTSGHTLGIYNSEKGYQPQ